MFDHILDASDTANGGSFTFFISNDHIASMNPAFKGKRPEPFHAVPLKKKEGKYCCRLYPAGYILCVIAGQTSAIFVSFSGYLFFRGT